MSSELARRRFEEFREASPETKWTSVNWSPTTIAQDPAACLFCEQGLAAGRAKEHVFPQWLLRHYNVKSELMRGTWAEGKTLYATKRSVRTQNLASLVHGHVCRDCNAGWMSDLEAEVMTLLIDLAEGKRSPDLLTTSERELLARWTVKTTAALNHASNFHTLVTYEQARATRTGPPNAGVSVFARQMPQTHDPISWLQSHAGPGITPEGIGAEEMVKATASGWRISLAIGRLLIGAFYLPGDDWLHCPREDLHVPVWPTGQSWPTHESQMEIENDLPAELTCFNTLEMWIIHESLREEHGSVELPA